MESPLSGDASLVAPDWTLARSDMRVRAALLDAVEEGRFSRESAAQAAGVPSNVIRTWLHRHRSARIASADGKPPTKQLPSSRAATAHRTNPEGRDSDAQEVSLLAQLPNKLAKKIERATEGREAKAFTDALATVLDLQRRATGRANTLERSSRPPSQPRTLITFGAVPLSIPQNSRAREGAFAAPALDAEVVSSTQGPPGLATLLAGLPEWQRNL